MLFLFLRLFNVNNSLFQDVFGLEYVEFVFEKILNEEAENFEIEAIKLFLGIVGGVQVYLAKWVYSVIIAQGLADESHEGSEKLRAHVATFAQLVKAVICGEWIGKGRDLKQLVDWDRGEDADWSPLWVPALVLGLREEARVLDEAFVHDREEDFLAL